MAKSELYATAKYAIELMKMIENGEQLDAWVQSKITKAADYINSVKRYMEGEKAAEDTPNVHDPEWEQEEDERNDFVSYDHLGRPLEEAYVPSNIEDFAKRKGASAIVKKVAGWAKKVGKRITGGTAIGYNYSTLILDMKYQGSEIRINLDNNTITLYGEPVGSLDQFRRVFTANQEENLEEGEGNDNLRKQEMLIILNQTLAAETDPEQIELIKKWISQIESELGIAGRLDPVGHEDEDIDNDGKKNTKTDKYLKSRRVKIGKAISQYKKK
jgi:hypothetical protein